MESVTSKPSSVMPGIGAAVSVIVHSTAPTMAEPAAGAKPLTPRQTRVTTQHKVWTSESFRFGIHLVESQQTEQTLTSNPNSTPDRIANFSFSTFQDPRAEIVWRRPFGFGDRLPRFPLQPPPNLRISSLPGGNVCDDAMPILLQFFTWTLWQFDMARDQDRAVRQCYMIRWP